MADRTATWYLIQFSADLKRREPRNLGIVLDSPDGWKTRFFAVDGGKVNGSRLRSRGLTKDAYEAWLGYFDRKIAAGDWEQVIRTDERRVKNFRTLTGGHLYEQRSDWDAEADRIYGELVTDSVAAASSDTESDLQSVVQRILRRAEINPIAGYRTPVDYGRGRLEEVSWDFAHRNGSLHLMRGLKLGWRPLIQAEAFNSRAAAAAKAAPDELHFVCFYDGLDDPASDQAQHILAPIEAVGRSIDVRDEAEAVETVREAMNA